MVGRWRDSREWAGGEIENGVRKDMGRENAIRSNKMKKDCPLTKPGKRWKK